MTDDMDLISLKGAAKLANCHPTTIWRAIKNDELKAKRVPVPLNMNKPWWGIEPADLDQWIAKRNKTAKQAESSQE